MKIQFDFSERINKYGLILTSIYIKGKQAVMLIDTGATNNVIDLNFIKENDIKIPTLVKGKLFGFNSDSEFIFTKQIIKDILVENVFKTNIEFTITDFEKTTKMFMDEYGIKFNGILGNDFLIKHNATIDFNNKKIIYENNN